MRNPYGKPLGGAPRAAGNSGSHRSTAASWLPIFEAIPVVMSRYEREVAVQKSPKSRPAQSGSGGRDFARTCLSAASLSAAENYGNQKSLKNTYYHLLTE